MYTVITDARFEAISRPAQNAAEAKEFMLEDIAWFMFYCDEQQSIARNSIERKQWAEKRIATKQQWDIVNETPLDMLRYGMVAFVGEFVFQIRI